MNYADIKDLAARERIPVTDLIALAPANDPMYVGKPNDYIQAEWFARLWQEFGYSTGVHLRRVHYQLVSQRPRVQFPEGVKVKIGPNEWTTEYLNTESCWDYLTQAGKVARYLNLVPAESFVDRRNPDPKINIWRYDEEPEITVDSQEYAELGIPSFPSKPSLSLSAFYGRQRYHLEVWAEKSTMNDVLIPLCERYNVNYITGLGEMSITSTLNAVDRIVEDDREAVILYISDFDPAGMSMPVAVSRKIEYFTSQRAGEVPRIRLIPIVLTAAQVKQYDLPRTPIKESERRGAAFEERHGSGAVELDALQALHPGTLARIVTSHIKEWYDTDLNTRVWQAKEVAQAAIEAAQQAVYDRHAAELAQLQQLYDEIVEAAAEKMARFNALLGPLWETMTQELTDERPDIEDYPIPEAEQGAGEDRWPLFDTGRGYLEQIRAYKHHQGKNGTSLED